MESTAIDAIPDGCLFAYWIAKRGIKKSTAYSWRSALGIQPIKRRVDGRLEVWLTTEQENLLDAYGDALDQGATAAQALARVGIQPTPTESDVGQSMARVEVQPVALDSTAPAEPAEPGPLESAGVHQLDQLRARLAALRDAVDLGAPLSTAEATLLLGARPGGDEVIRGRLRAIREARNCWTIELE